MLGYTGVRYKCTYVCDATGADEARTGSREGSEERTCVDRQVDSVDTGGGGRGGLGGGRSRRGKDREKEADGRGGLCCKVTPGAGLETWSDTHTHTHTLSSASRN